MTLEEIIRRRLARPLTPEGKDIEWDHPVLIFFVENGTIPGSETDESKAAYVIREESERIEGLCLYETIGILDPYFRG